MNTCSNNVVNESSEEGIFVIILVSFIKVTKWIVSIFRPYICVLAVKTACLVTIFSP